MTVQTEPLLIEGEYPAWENMSSFQRRAYLKAARKPLIIDPLKDIPFTQSLNDFHTEQENQ